MMKDSLGNMVKDIKPTDRLTDSPVCLAASESDVDIHLERFLKQHGQIQESATRILEINPSHPLIAKMASKAAGKDDKTALKDLSLLLFDQARLMDGETLSDPVGFARRLGEVMAKVV
jgi:molecular chaperone HtpG